MTACYPTATGRPVRASGRSAPRVSHRAVDHGATLEPDLLAAGIPQAARGADPGPRVENQRILASRPSHARRR